MAEWGPAWQEMQYAQKQSFTNGAASLMVDLGLGLGLSLEIDLEK